MLHMCTESCSSASPILDKLYANAIRKNNEKPVHRQNYKQRHTCFTSAINLIALMQYRLYLCYLYFKP